MPTGPQGQKRPVSTVQAAVMVGRIATRQIAEEHVHDEMELRPAANEAKRDSSD